MPSKRTASGQRRRQQPQRGRKAMPVREGLTPIQRDLIGVGLVVVAIAMLVSVIAPSSALVTRAAHDALALSFGVAAVLVPIALLMFAITFFLDEDGPVSGRVAIGLALVVLAILGLFSLNMPGANSEHAAVVVQPDRILSAGGYVGGGIAYVLLTLVGTVIGNVVLVGVIITGAVVCGFSISGMVARARGRISQVVENRKERAAERRAQQIIDEAADYEYEAATPARAQASLFDAGEEPATTFIGDRKTTVLTRSSAKPSRGKKDKSAAPGNSDCSEEPATTLLPAFLSGKGGAKKKAAKAEPAGTLFEIPEQESDEAVFEAATTLLPARSRRAQKDASKSQANPAVAAAVSKASAAKASSGTKKTTPAPSTITRPGDGDESYELPPLSILRENDTFNGSWGSDKELSETAGKLQGTLEEFGLSSRVEGWIAGPSVTTFKISMGEGERVNKIVNLEDDIALSLAAKSVRIFAPIPGTSLVGIEIPNETPQPVFLSDVLPHAQGGPLDCAFGRDSEGAPIVVDLAGLPHLLVAGTTGSGKSVLLNAIIMSMLMRATPEQVRLIMVDPKRVEFTGYAGLPHLYVPVVTEPRQAASALQWGVTEMERRLKVFEHYKVRDIRTYNSNVDGGRYEELENPPVHMPYFVIVIDELADLMMVAGKDVETSIVRIAQLGRAAGIHLIVATQRPSADVVTGLIRANIDNRVALSVDNSINSRIILDQKGAEQLLGKGDMLVKLRGSKPRRAQGCWVSDEEIEKTVEFVRNQVTADYHEDILTAVVPSTPGGVDPTAPKEDDPLVWQAARIVVDSQLGSTSSLQRALSVGYARAGRIMDCLEAKGIVGPANGSKPRDVLIDAEGLEDLRIQEECYREVE